MPHDTRRGPIELSTYLKVVVMFSFPRPFRGYDFLAVAPYGRSDAASRVSQFDLEGPPWHPRSFAEERPSVNSALVRLVFASLDDEP